MDREIEWQENYFAIKILLDNDAFQDEGRFTEVARILREMADQVEKTRADAYIIHDANGNNAGRAVYDKF